MGLKISEYVNAHALPIDTDLYDVSADIGAGLYQSRSIAWSVIKGEVNSLYNNDGTIAAGRVATITDTIEWSGGKSVFGASALGYASMNFGNGVNPSAPVDGDMWWNGTNLFFRDGVLNKDLLSGGIYIGSGTVPTSVTSTITDTWDITGGFVKINGAASNIPLAVKGNDSLSTGVTFGVENSGVGAPSNLLKVMNDGDVFVKKDLQISTGVLSENNIEMFSASYSIGVSSSPNGIILKSAGNVILNPSSTGLGSGLEEVLIVDQAKTIKARFNVNNGRLGIGVVPTEVVDLVGNVNITGAYKVSSIQVVGAQGAAVVDATGTATGTDAVMINELKTQLNALLSRVRVHGLIA